ncbi:MAG TPA: hypothetical protein VMU51_38570 [Mycobacteriales bacterium]|nr:hypothetical protein [Mycobacteriales bacterium]
MERQRRRWLSIAAGLLALCVYVWAVAWVVADGASCSPRVLALMCCAVVSLTTISVACWFGGTIDHLQLGALVADLEREREKDRVRAIR